MLYLVEFILQELPEDDLMAVIPWAWYNGWYTMAAEPIKSMELHFPIIMFLIAKFNLASQNYISV